LDLLLPMQSVPINTNVVSLNPVHGDVCDTTLCDNVSGDRHRLHR
jgi:hypothetical protein